MLNALLRIVRICIISTIIHQNSTIFKTIDDETTLSGQRIVSALQARRIAQEEVNLSIQKHIAQLELDKTALTQLEQKIASGISYEEAYAQSMTKASVAAKEHAIQTKGLSGTTDTFVAKQKVVQTELEATATSSRLASVGVKALSTAFNMFAGMAIMWGITKIIEGFEYLSESAERAKEKLSEIQTELNDNNSTYQNNRSTLVGLKEEYDSLIKKAEALGGAQNLANDEYERYQAITSQILGITPKLTTGWNKEGEAISNKNNLLQASIDLLDEEYEKSLRNNTTKSKNEDVASGVIAKLDKFNNDPDTQYRSGTMANMRESFLDELEKLETELGMTEHDIVEKMWVYFDPKADPNDFWSDHVDTYEELRDLIEKDYDKFANSFVDENNPIYELFSDEVIRNMIRNANEYFAEGKRILDERELLYQDFKDQLNWNAQAVGDAYSDLDEQTKAGITQMIDSFDYNDMTKEKFSDMATDLKDFVGKLSTDDTLRSYFNNLFKPMGEDESIEDYESRVKTGIDEITSYCENNYPAIKLSFGDVEKDVETLQKQYDNIKNNLVNSGLSEEIAKQVANGFSQSEIEKILDSNDIDWSYVTEGITDDLKNEDWYAVTEGYKNAVDECEEYVKSLPDYYKQYGNINNVDREIIRWTKENVEKYKDVLEQWNIDYSDYTPDDWSTVLGWAEKVPEMDDLTVALTAMLQTENGYEILTPDSLYDYLSDVYQKASEMEGGATGENILKVDKDGIIEDINGIETHVSGMIAAIEGQVVNGAKLTYDDVMSIGGNYDNEENVSKRTFDSMHTIQAEALYSKKAYEELNDEAKKTGETADDLIRDYDNLGNAASIARDRILEVIDVSSNPDKTDNLSFTDLLNSSDYKDIKEKLLDVAKSGEITEETLSSTEEYNKLLEETGTSADRAKNQILDMLSAQEKLSAATQGLNKLKSAYEEFKDEDIGFVTAQTLESLPDSFKKLGGFDSFSQIVGDPTSSTEAIQQAFNDIVKQYLISQDTLSQLVNASKHEIQSYIANLKQMGITNADEIVNQTINVLSQENELINEASDEYYKAYVKYLDSKDKADLSYVESVASKSSQLSNALGQPYQTDYNNWCELLKKKAEAYNNFITKLGSSFDKISIPNAPYSEEGLNQKKAEAIINNAKGKKVLSWDELNNASTKNTIEMMRNLGNVADYSKEQVEAAEEYLEALKIATEYKNTLKLDLSAIDTNFTSSFSPDVSSGKDTKDSKESFDFIEIAISRLTDALDKLKTKADDVYSTWGSRNASLADAINKTKTAIDLQSQAYSAYMQQANSVGLPSYYKTLVQNGAIKISDISDETLKDQISEYQNWYEKAQDCLKTQNDLNDELNELKSQKFDDLKTQYDDIIGRMEASKDLLESQITLLSSSVDYNSLRGQQRAIVNGLKEELASLTKEFNSSGVLYGTEKWYDLQSQIDDIKQQIVDAEATLKDIDNLQFDNIKEAFDFDTTVLEHGIQMIQNKIDILEMKGQFANESYYNGMIQYTQKELDTLIKERTQLQNILNNTLYKQGTSEWNDMYSTLMDIDEEIDSMTSNLTEFNNAIRDLNWDIFEYLEESINRITDETDYLIELLSKEDLYDKDNGNLTKYADAAIALHATAYDTYKQQAQDYYEEVQDLQRQLVNGAGKDVLEQYNEMVDAHQDAILAAEDEKQAILDLIEDGYNAQLDALQKLIDKKKEQLQIEKNLFDYQKSIKEKTDNISSLEKQKLAYDGDNSEEAISKIQQIKVQLEEAKADLEETEYEQYLQDSQNMLDTLASDYEEWMNNRLDNEDALLSEIIGTVSGKGNEINSTLNEVADKYGTMISDSITSIFDAKSPFTNMLSNGITTINNSIAGTTSAINRLIAQVANITNANASKTNAGSGNNGSNPKPIGNSNNGNNTNTSSNVGNNNSNNSTPQNSSNNSVWGSWFIRKTDSYPKDKLDIQNSIVDRLKYNSIDSSFSARSKYYSAMGGSGIYTGSSSQNTWMLSQLKSHGYAKGSKYIPYDQIALLGEKGNELQFDKSEGVLREVGEGDKIFTNEASKVLWDLSKDPSAFLEKFGLANITSQFNVVTPTLPKMERNNVSNSVNMSVDGVEINLPNVTNYKEFRNELIKDSTFTNAMGTYVNNKIMGKNPLEHLKYVNH